jgi:hypothetical protein
MTGADKTDMVGGRFNVEIRPLTTGVASEQEEVRKHTHS